MQDLKIIGAQNKLLIIFGNILKPVKISKVRNPNPHNQIYKINHKWFQECGRNDVFTKFYIHINTNFIQLYERNIKAWLNQ